MARRFSLAKRKCGMCLIVTTLEKTISHSIAMSVSLFHALSNWLCACGLLEIRLCSVDITYLQTVFHAVNQGDKALAITGPGANKTVKEKSRGS